MVNKSYKFRIYPTPSQETYFRKTIGCTRFIYNYFLELWNKTYEETGKGLKRYKCTAMLPPLKEEYPWLKDADIHALRYSIADLETAFTMFYKRATDRPRFKTKKSARQSYSTWIKNKNQDVSYLISGGKIKLPKVGLVKIRKHRDVPGRIFKATVSVDYSGNWYVSLATEESVTEDFSTGAICGVDLGIKDFAILSCGTIYRNPAFKMREQKRLSRAERKLSKRRADAVAKGLDLLQCKNYQKQRRVVAKLHSKIKNKRKDFMHKVSSEIVKNHDIIGIEDLHAESMMKNSHRKMNYMITDASWRTFRSMLEYKSLWYGKSLVVVSRNFPSSQMCSTCGCINKAVKDLGLREWECPNCGAHHDRDLNASYNLRNEAVRITAGVAD